MTDLIDRLISGLTVTENDAKQDRIQLKFKRWTFQGNMLQFGRFSTRLSRTFDVDGVQRRIFNKRQGEERRAIWPITGGTGSRRYVTPPGVPLFSGRLRGYQQQSGPDQPIKTWHLIAELSLNPTRTVLHERDLLLLATLERDMKLAIPAPLFAGTTPALGTTLPFISGDNFERGSRLHRLAFRQPNWGINVERYWKGVVDLFDTTLAAAADHAGGAIYQVGQKLTLQTMETYWEFADPDPIATVAALERPFRSLGSKSSVEWYTFPEAARATLRNRGVIIADDDNAPVIKVHVAKGTQIKAYAKTAASIRFEVTHTQGSADIGAYTATDMDGLFRWIHRTTAGSTIRLNALLDQLGRALSPASKRQYQPQRLLYDLYEVYHDWPLALRTFGILINAGKIEARQNSPLGDDVERLVRKKIIHRVSPPHSNVRIFTVTERYKDALAALQGG
ncbi:hypothetical protein [Shinella zoogloeoides]|uniref:hypothetical protein n=1 Tax=Shinella zoogloeoides TaxID=352475 RepID=UPI00273E697C|nr:hypothetical protein [Shinella zoogloeoides]WLR93875.1 hypothetical protein Q9316_06725 [Shinella zoogloeoides]